MAFSLQLCLEGQNPGDTSSLLTLRQVFCGYYLTKLPVEDLSVSQTRQSSVHVLSILVISSLLCYVKGVVHSIVRDLQFPANFSHGIAFIS